MKINLWSLVVVVVVLGVVSYLGSCVFGIGVGIAFGVAAAAVAISTQRESNAKEKEARLQEQTVHHSNLKTGKYDPKYCPETTLKFQASGICEVKKGDQGLTVMFELMLSVNAMSASDFAAWEIGVVQFSSTHANLIREALENAHCACEDVLDSTGHSLAKCKLQEAFDKHRVGVQVDAVFLQT